MSKLLRKIFGGLLSIGILISGITGGQSPALAFPDSVHVTVHYNRTNGDYTTWNLYLFRNNDGSSDKEVASAGFDFSGTDSFGAIATADFTGMTGYKDVGWIIRKGAWVSKEGSNCGPTSNGDRFVSPDNAGNAEIWILQGDCTIYATAPYVAPPTPKITYAAIDDLRKITVYLNQNIDLTAQTNGGFTLNGGLIIASVAPIVGTSTQASSVTITTTADIPFGASYTVTQTGADADHTFGSFPVSVGNVMNSAGFNSLYTYSGNDLGATYAADKTDFRVWAPVASQVNLLTYTSATQPTAQATVTPMSQAENGTWTASLAGDKKGTIYMYQVTRNGETVVVIDPYARSAVINGSRGVVVDLAGTDPAGWNNNKPAFTGHNVDASIYEVHVRDFSKDASSGIPVADRGKFKAFTDNNTSYTWTTSATNPKTRKRVTTSHTVKTGVAAIKALGVSHVQLLPIYDYASGGDEADPTFNWGYDPQNYNVPEGAYASDPANPNSRVTDLKAAVQNLHNQGLRVIMDVVYNHVASASNFSMEMITPGYFFRRDESGTLLNGTGCGNETASERPMVRKFIVDSVKYWAGQYHLDGFRFDLMGILDVTTMQQVRAALDAVDPTIIVIGEGWDMGGLPSAQRASQVNIGSLDGIAAFNDQIRDGIKGSVFNASEAGWATGNSGRENDVKAGITGNVAYNALISPNWITNDPGQSVNYVEAHDNLTLADKLTASVGATQAVRSRLQRFAGSIDLLAQGLPFMQAGQEWERTKNGDDNSYSSGDGVNMLRYKQLDTYSTTLHYYAGILALRKAHPSFRLTTTAAVRSGLKFLSSKGGVISYSLNGAAAGDKWSSIVVSHNPNAVAKTISLPGAKATWYVVVKDDKAGVATLAKVSATTVSVPARSTLVLHK